MKNAQIPTGTKDVLPAEAAELRWLEARLRESFASFGYREVITPSLEMEPVMELAGEARFKKSFRLFDERGDVLMLRPEMTTPIARLIATKLMDEAPPIRLSYFANSFRPTTPQRGRQSEFYQAGLELVGIESPAVDAEVLAVLCRALDACGLKEYSIGLGEASFFRALLEAAGVSDAEREAIFAALAGRDLVELESVVGGLRATDDDKSAILAVSRLRGGSEVLVEAQDFVRGPAMEEALKRLARTYYLVSRYGYARRLLFDLGILRNFEYYTGIVFEILSSELGFPIGGGGRYDGLLARFGRPAPAVGFAVGLDRLHIAVTGQGGMPRPAAARVALVGGLDEGLNDAGELRERGVSVMALPGEMEETAALAAAGSADISRVLFPMEGEKYRLLEVADGASRTMTLVELIDELAAGE